jgi:hypothetical protein
VTWNVRMCGECRERFMPTRLDQRLCSACASESDELQKLLAYLRAHPEDPVTRVSVSTGVSEQSISRFAEDGRLPVVPRGAEPKRTCECGGKGRCPVCKAAVATRIVRAAGPLAASLGLEPDSARRAAGMRSRRPGSR